ncbi:hypothetical protein C8J57DRAFT_1197399 [Mycena rebaudengoi]|nr:hypothetical protein C8J57DRAFT_1197399 [Mycena rebaudengoi]
MTILVTGGTGKTATALAHLLHKANQPFLVASRDAHKVAAPFTGTRFDWLDATTYNIPFEAAPDIDRVYLIAPPVLDMLPPMKVFIEFAIEKGVKRFVLMSAAMFEKGGPIMGQVHAYLATLPIEYMVLRPSWFYDNFLPSMGVRFDGKNTLVSAAGDGLMGYLSTEDIAEVAFKGLVDDVIQHDNPIIVGPELLSYDKIAATLSEVIGREVVHKRLTEDEYKQVYLERGVPDDYAQFLAMLDGSVDQGVEEELFHRADVVGKITIREFFEKNKDLWKL